MRSLGLPVLLAVVLTGPALGAGETGRKAGQGARGPAAAECRKDADCVLVADGCCGCHEGGKQRAIPSRARAAHEKKRQGSCRETVCPAVMSQDPSCSAAAAVCKEGMCKLAS
jgi:hypothetical protein